MLKPNRQVSLVRKSLANERKPYKGTANEETKIENQKIINAEENREVFNLNFYLGKLGKRKGRGAILCLFGFSVTPEGTAYFYASVGCINITDKIQYRIVRKFRRRTGVRRGRLVPKSMLKSVGQVLN